MDYHSQHPMDLHFDAGEIIEVLGIENEDWWNGSIQNTQKLGTFKFGSFPKIFVEFESRPDPVSRCEPVVVAKDFEVSLTHQLSILQLLTNTHEKLQYQRQKQ
ncbi:unnamed protein product [Rhizophagus irregularis]|nr:unnamed protein product [Rhizophagus irregularis]